MPASPPNFGSATCGGDADEERHASAALPLIPLVRRRSSAGVRWSGNLLRIVLNSFGTKQALALEVREFTLQVLLGVLDLALQPAFLLFGSHESLVETMRLREFVLRKRDSWV